MINSASLPVDLFSISEHLALNYSENYSTIYDQHGKPLMWLITASLPFQMTAREWSFPLVGSFTYKGFFNQESAEIELEELKLNGWDVMIREVGGWSTLGWFKDPVLSEMLNRSTGKLAELIIHELTHGTLYVKDSVEFNENLASFVGTVGTEQFLIYRFGGTSKEYLEYINQLNDQELFTEHFLRGFDHLNKFYEKIDIPKKEDTLTKHRIIYSVLNHIDTLNLNNPTLYTGMFENFTPNNAYFMSFQRYRSKQVQLSEDLKNTYGGDLEMYIQSLIIKFESL